MKRRINHLFFVLVVLCGIALSNVSLGQAPPPPPTVKGTDTNKGPGGGAPVEGGILVVLSMIGAFGSWKMLKSSQHKSESTGH